MNKKYVIPIAFFISIFIIPMFVFAEQSEVKIRERDQDRIQEPQNKMMEANKRNEEKVQLREKTMEQKCDELNNRMTNRIMSFMENKKKHTENYDKFVTRIEELLVRLEDKGYDVSDLKAHVGVIKGMMQDYAVEYSNFISTLEDSTTLTCGQGDGLLKDAMKSAQDELKALQEKRREIKNYYAQVIRQDIAKIRQDASAMNNDKTGGDNE